MAHVIEPATSGRAKCRGCKQPIAKDELRLGERLPNPFGDGEMTLWFHPLCAAFKRPETLLAALESTEASIQDRETLQDAAQCGLDHPHLPRLDGVRRAPTGRARCRSCRELIAQDSWRIALVSFEDGRFDPSGYLHASCSRAHFGSPDILRRLRRFQPDLTDSDVLELEAELGS